MFQMKNKGVSVSFRKFCQKKKDAEAAAKREVVFQDKDQGIEIVR